VKAPMSTNTPNGLIDLIFPVKDAPGTRSSFRSAVARLAAKDQSRIKELHHCATVMHPKQVKQQFQDLRSRSSQ
jgi:hypothetical protein